MTTKRERVELTKRQYDCAQLAGRGKTTEEIALALDLAHPTVRHHLDAARKKLGVAHKRQLHDRLAEVTIDIKEVTHV